VDVGRIDGEANDSVDSVEPALERHGLTLCTLALPTLAVVPAHAARGARREVRLATVVLGWKLLRVRAVAIVDCARRRADAVGACQRTGGVLVAARVVARAAVVRVRPDVHLAAVLRLAVAVGVGVVARRLAGSVFARDALRTVR